MSNVLIVDCDPKRTMLFKINLLSKFDLNIYEKQDLDGAINLIESVNDFDLIICCDSNDSKSLCKAISQFLIKNFLPFPMVALTDNKIEYDRCLTFSNQINYEIIFDEIFQLIDVDSKLKILNDFIPVPLAYFKSALDQVQMADIYLRIKNGNEPSVFLKRLHKGERFEFADLDRYANSNLTDFYVAKEQFSDFKKSANLFLKEALENKDLSYLEKHYAEHATYAITQEMILNLGVDLETIELVQKNIEAMTKSIGDKGACASFLKSLNTNKESYLYNHVFLMSMLLTKVVDKFEWSTASVKEKFLYAAYFHDITLNIEKLAKINSNSELIDNELSSYDIKRINSHAFDAASIVEKLIQVPMGVSTIIREHHGSRNGYGFSEDLNLSITPLSMIFIVVETFVSKFIELPDKFSQESITSILDHLRFQFNKSTYQEAFTHLNKIVFNNN